MEAVEGLNQLLDSINEDVCILVNNVGKAHANPFHKHPYEMLFTMLHVNICS